MRQNLLADNVDTLIYTIRGHRVMLDSDLARIYGVLTKNLNRAVKRNRERFPSDFMFQLTPEEASRFHFGTLKRGQNVKHLPYAFTEHGAVMLSAVLRTPIAVAASISVVRAFNRLRQLADKHKDLAAALSKLEREIKGQDARLDSHADRIEELFAAVREIMEPPIPSRKRIGFR